MSSEANKAVVLRFYDQLNSGNTLEAVDELFAPDFVAHFPGRPHAVRGRDEFKKLLADYLTAFPDLTETTEALIAEGDLVAIRETYRATHEGHFQGVLPTGTGEFQDIRPTGRPIQLTGIDIYRIQDGRVVEQWIEQDLLGLLQQLGAVAAR